MNYFFRKILFAFLLFLMIICYNPLRAQSIKATQIINPDNYIEIVQKLKNSQKSNLTYQQDIELPALIAFSYYPELWGTKIEFVKKSLKTSMAARPAVLSFFKRKKNRTYKIFINNHPHKVHGLMFDEISFNEKIGILGHEFGHIADYRQKSKVNLIGNAVGYLFSSFKKKLEAKTDSIAVAHHLGYQLCDFMNYSLNSPNVSAEYKIFQKDIYLDDLKIKAIMDRHPEY